MKKRLGFVSNSSSSSFLCDVCEQEGCGYDASPSDFDMAVCEKYHTFCYDHAIEPEKPCTVTNYDGSVSTYENMFEAEEFEGEVPSQYCPICAFEKLSVRDYRKYLEKTDRGMEAIFKEIRDRFATYEDFHRFLKEKE